MRPAHYLSIAHCCLPERWCGEIRHKRTSYWQLWFLSQSNYSWLITCQTRAYHQKCDCFKNQSNSAGARPLPPTSCKMMPGCDSRHCLDIIHNSRYSLTLHISGTLFPLGAPTWCLDVDRACLCSWLGPVSAVTDSRETDLSLAGWWPAGARCSERHTQARRGESPAADLVTSQAEIPDYRDLNVFVLHIITVVSSDFTYLERESVTFERWMIRIIFWDCPISSLHWNISLKKVTKADFYEGQGSFFVVHCVQIWKYKNYVNISWGARTFSVASCWFANKEWLASSNDTRSLMMLWYSGSLCWWVTRFVRRS